MRNDGVGEELTSEREKVMRSSACVKWVNDDDESEM
jgi:hypothetical protein